MSYAAGLFGSVPYGKLSYLGRLCCVTEGSRRARGSGFDRPSLVRGGHGHLVGVGLGDSGGALV